MKKHAKRHQRAKEIRAAAAEMIRTDAAGIDWIQAAEGAGDSPKRFSMLAYTGGDMRVERYGDPIIIDCATLKATAPIPILLDHDSTRIVGHADEINILAASVKVSGIISGAGQAAVEVVASAKQGFPWKASVGAMPDRSGLEWVGEGVATKVNGRSFKGPLMIARNATLREVSFVAVAADGKTSAHVAARAAQPSEKETSMDPKFREWIEAMGLVVDDLRPDQVAKLQAKYDAEIKAAAVDGIKPAKVETPKFDVSGIVVAYEKHVAGIQAKAAGYIGKIDAGKLAGIQAKAQTAAIELKAKALNEEWAPTRLEVELIKAAADAHVEMIHAERPVGPAIHSSTKDNSPDVIEAAFCKSAGLQHPEKSFKPEVLEAADRGYKNFGLQELLVTCAQANGYVGRPRVGNDNLREVINAAFSTHTISTLLSSTGNKILLEGFTAIPQTWREVAEIRSVSDFKTVTAFRMTSSLDYEEVGPGGEIKHGTLGQESYTMQAKTYAKMLSLTRQDIINDDLGAFDAIRQRLGIGAANKMNERFWYTWLYNSSLGTFWTAARTNLVTSAALAEAGLNSVVQAFRDMAGPDGNLMALEPDRILVPSALEATARKLYVSQEMRDTTASTKFQTSNIYFNRFRPIIVPECGNSSYTGYSATTWWMLANPAVLASAAMCFLNGQQNPTIESADADFNTLGIQFRGYHDFGVSMTEYRASVKATA